MAKKKAGNGKNGKNGKKTDKQKLADGAAAIKKAQAEAAKAEVEHVELKPLKMTTEEVVRNRVKLLPGNIGLEISEDTTIEENLVLLDWTMQMSDHVGFMIGDVLNFGEHKFGTKYTAALNQTNRALSTLKGYAEAARRIPADKRQAALSFTHHREVLRLPDEKMASVLEELGTQAEKGEAPTVKELRFKIQKLTPRKAKKTKRVTSGKTSKRARKVKEVPPYEPTSEEQANLDGAEEYLSLASQAITENKLYGIVARLDNKEKRRWVELCKPIVTFYNAVDRVTGY